MNELEMIKRCQMGEKPAFQELISVYYPYVSKYLLKLTDDEHISEDLTQDTFLRLIRSIDRYDIYGHASFATYVMTIAKRLYIDHLRKNKQVHMDIDGLVLDSGINVEHMVLKGIQIGEVIRQLENLHPDQAVAIKMKYLEEKTLVEIAHELHTKPTTIKSRIHNGMVKLRKSLKGGNEDG